MRYTFFLYLILLSLCSSLSLHSQNIEHYQQGYIYDASTKESIPYATIVNRTTGNGTVSNTDGFYKIPATSSDSLEISFIGYQQIKSTVADLPSKIYLKAANEMLGEVLLLADDDYLYKMVSNIKKTSTYKSKTARTYLSLETHAKGKQLEQLESYYNGSFAGYDVEKLAYKNGRIGLAEVDGRFFVSSETSMAMHMHKIFQYNAHFPKNPLEFKKKKLKKWFHIQLNKRFIDEQGRVIYVLDYTPKEKEKEAFYGTLWMDSLSHQLIKLELNVKNSKQYPFTALFPNDTLKNVDMHISKSFEEIEGQMYVKSIDFDYQITYHNRANLPYTVKSKAVLYAYDYTKAFIEPKFVFPGERMRHGDYRKINAAPYNHYFWEHMDEFRLHKKESNKHDFYEKHSVLSSANAFVSNNFFSRGSVEHAYMLWSDKRIRFRNEEPQARQKEFKPHMLLAQRDRYHLEAQLYFDLTEIGDSLHLNTATVFDPYQSYYFFEHTDTGSAFINMYFDIMEIQRRRLITRIQKIQNDKEAIWEAYETAIHNAKKITNNFINEVQRGSQRRAMEKWNRYIMEELNIDNLDLFQLYTDETVQGNH